MDLFELTLRVVEAGLQCISAICAPIIAAFAVMVSVIALMSERSAARVATRTQTLLDLLAAGNGEDMVAARSAAAGALLRGDFQSTDVARVMNYFSTVSTMVDTGTLDRGLAFDQFSWWIIRYWLAVKPSIAARRMVDPSLWRTLEKVAGLMWATELRKGASTTAYEPAALRSFLRSEVAIARRRNRRRTD